jgi:hypothetical protein
VKNSRDLRNFARQTTTRLIAGGLLLLFIIGDGLIYLFYGSASAVMGLICIGAGMVPILLILGFFWVTDWIVKRSRDE